ncbi:palmitoyltransferase ZDHHC20-B-like [Amblyomma americanum]
MLGRVIRIAYGGARRVVCWLPVLFAVVSFGETYYAYMLVFCGRFVKEDALRFALGGVFHLLLLFCLWSYARTTLTPLPLVPRRFELSEDERRDLARCAQNQEQKNALLDAMASRRGVLTRYPSGAVSFCVPCKQIKPDRSHHCSNCRRCILKLDHHCPWFNSCVCFSTYKTFLLTLFYVALLSGYVAASVSTYLHAKQPHRSLLHRSRHINFLLIVGCSMFVMISGFLVMHLSFVVRNRTTIESMRPPTFKQKGDSFDVGTYRNIVEVFGPKTAFWLLPVFSSLGDGSWFPTRLHPSKQSMTTASEPDSPEAKNDVEAPSQTGELPLTAAPVSATIENLATATTGTARGTGCSSSTSAETEVTALLGAAELLPWREGIVPDSRKGRSGPLQIATL